MPVFSVITVCFNEAVSIRKTLNSIVSQTFKDYELIVVDGGSTDGTADIVKEYREHIAWWCSEKDRGIYHAMNKGVEHATGEYVIFMNAGDWFVDDKVLDKVCKNRISADVTEGYVLDTAKKKRIKEKYEDIYAHLFADTICHQGAFIRRKLLLAHPYDEKYKIVADWKFWLETLILEKHSYSFVDLNIAFYDMSGISSDAERVRKERDEVYKELFPPHVVGLIHSYYDAYDLAAVKYAVYLNKHSHRGYEILRKIAKRIVKTVKLFNFEKTYP